MPYFLQHFAKNWGQNSSARYFAQKWLISRRSTRFGGFALNAILFSNILLKSMAFGEKPLKRVDGTLQ